MTALTFTLVVLLWRWVLLLPLLLLWPPPPGRSRSCTAPNLFDSGTGCWRGGTGIQKERALLQG